MTKQTHNSDGPKRDANSSDLNLSDADLDAVTGGSCMPLAPTPATTSMKANANTQNNLAAALKA